MLYKTLVYLHVSGALVLGVLIAYALLLVIKNRTEQLATQAKNIGIGLGFQLVSGSVLVLEQQTRGSANSFCQKIGLYLVTVAAAEALLFYKMKQSKTPVNFPLVSVLISAGVGLAMTIYTLVAAF